ncbi:MAG: hypothetical protein E6Q83_03505 [Thiothrix sp.]|nr:MAG: hypothetical protein E6Q83_03505 [Thiothrix sp.]
MIALTGARTYPAAAIIKQTPTGISYKSNTTINSVPTGAQHSVSILVTPTSTADVEVSFDSGTTWPLTIYKGSSQSWGNDSTNGISLTQMRFRPAGYPAGVATYNLWGD